MHSLKEQLLHAEDTCEIVDAAGNKLGRFTPEYVGYECPLSDEELDQIERRGGGRPLKDILRDLEGGRELHRPLAAARRGDFAKSLAAGSATVNN